MKLDWKKQPSTDILKEALVAYDSETGLQKVFAVNYNPWRVIVPAELSNRTFGSEANLKFAVEHFFKNSKITIYKIA